MSYVYKTTVAQMIEIDGLSCEIPAGVRFEDFEELQVDETFGLDPEWTALQRWWVESELRLAEKHTAGDGHLLAGYAKACRSMLARWEAEGLLYGQDVDRDRCAHMRRTMVKWLAQGKIPMAYFLERSEAIATMEAGLRTLLGEE